MFTFVLDFANSTLPNSFLVIIEQQKVRFILTFAVNPRTYHKYYQMLNYYKNATRDLTFHALMCI